tara:strand:+ start:199 stop:456 length:258 start_codon:yes stop_codon:yes gene_type:complete
MSELKELTMEKARLNIELENINILIGRERGLMPKSQVEYNKILKKIKGLECANKNLEEENLRIRKEFQAYREAILQVKEFGVGDE